MAVPDERGRVDRMFRMALGRPATSEEIEIGVEYVRDAARKMAEAGIADEDRVRAALGSFARVVLGSNEFLFVE
jgi:hypothetical protein